MKIDVFSVYSAGLMLSFCLDLNENKFSCVQVVLSPQSF